MMRSYDEVITWVFLSLPGALSLALLSCNTSQMWTPQAIHHRSVSLCADTAAMPPAERPDYTLPRNRITHRPRAQTDCPRRRTPHHPSQEMVQPCPICLHAISSNASPCRRCTSHHPTQGETMQPCPICPHALSSSSRSVRQTPVTVNHVGTSTSCRTEFPDALAPRRSPARRRRSRSRSRGRGEPRPTAAIPMDNPCCSCKLTWTAAVSHGLQLQ